MKLSQAITAVKETLYFLFVYREEDSYWYDENSMVHTAVTSSMPKKD